MTDIKAAAWWRLYALAERPRTSIARFYVRQAGYSGGQDPLKRKAIKDNKSFASKGGAQITKAKKIIQNVFAKLPQIFSLYPYKFEFAFYG